jgi:hypothetical protein
MLSIGQSILYFLLVLIHFLHLTVDYVDGTNIGLCRQEAGKGEDLGAQSDCSSGIPFAVIKTLLLMRILPQKQPGEGVWLSPGKGVGDSVLRYMIAARMPLPQGVL